MSRHQSFLRGDGKSLSANLETKRLLIRSINESDLPELIALQTNEEVMRFVGSGGARTVERIEQVHRNLLGLWREGNPIGGYAVCKREDGAFMGMACLEELKDGEGHEVPGQAEVMLYFKPEFWRQGYAKEVGLGFIELISSALREEAMPMNIGGERITKLVATAEPRNTASIALQESLGFTRGETITMIKGDRKVERIKFELDLKKLIEEGKPKPFLEGAAAAAEKKGDSRTP